MDRTLHSPKDSVPAGNPRRRGRNALLTTLLLAFPGVATLAAETPEVGDIVERANLAAYYAGEDGRSEARMRIVDERDRTQTRQFTILRRDVEDGGDQQYLVVFSRPSEFRGVVFLVEKHPGGDDDRWLYLPDQDLERRIAPGDKRTSFVGSHVFYEDVSGRHLEDDDHELVEVTDDHYKVRSTPRDGGNVEFAAYTTWIDRETYLPLTTEYKDDDGTVYRRIESSDVEEIDGYPTPMRMRVEDERMGGHTEVQFRGQEYDLGLPESVFTQRSLRNPPRDWLRR
ncbi:MAG: outer membrane lipoprotein-sorting protein [Halorhodospira halophila]|uniref:outer membrane lipoprotein-sorting protein n=1 Tax=Halorhodospira halophila TaxID=1053 RepID=UPI001913EBAE|nr:outer membrane lipoprotein-sorting protein [Halorhodospira halophila]MBK5943742.1 outer membrane lipoprotein-sorting protein [Halorhodospira halophila]MCC3749935.1 outer membrane lipoprotein-sorting protein [Halorhodospira halophila]